MPAPSRRFAPSLTAALAAAAVGALPAAVAAQVAPAGSAVVAGTVRAQDGRPLAGATVAFEPAGAAPNVPAAVAQTDASGRFRLGVPAGVGGRVVVRRARYEQSAVAVAAVAAGGRRDVGVTLAPLAQLDVVTVVAERDRPLLNTQDATTGGVITRRELQTLPTDARDPVTLGYTIPGVAQATGFFGDAPRLTINGQNSLYTQYAIDGLENNEGFLGGPRVDFPLAALQRLDVYANTYGAEFGRSSNGVVNYVTRAGTDAFTGELFAYNRPGLPLDARPAVRPRDPQAAADLRRQQEGFRRTQLGGAAGGALRPGRTYYFGALEFTGENEDRIASTASATFTGRERRQTYKGFARLDQGWSPTQTTTLQFAGSNVNRAGEGTGAVAPEADITVQRIGTVTALTHRSALRGGRASNVASAQLGTYRWNYPPTRSDLSTPQVTITSNTPGVDAQIVGSSNFVFDERELQTQLKNVFQADLGRGHALRLGADVARSGFELRGSQTNPAGSYVVLNEGNITPTGPNGRFTLRDVPANARVLSYTIDAAQAQVNLSQTLVGAFAEDRWRVSPALTVTYGVRWDYDDLTSRGESTPDLNNFQPRLSVNWLASPSTVLRAGAGLYAGKFPYAIYSDAVQFGPNGNQTVTFRGAEAPAFGQGPRSAALDRSQLPPGEIRRLFALGLEQPMGRQLSAGVQRQFGDRLGLALDGVLVHTVNLPRSWDLNANTLGIREGQTASVPVTAGDASRPVRPVAGGYRRLTTSESGGSAHYAGLYAVARYQAAGTVVFDANYVLSRSRNDTEDINFNATQGNRFDLEYADAVNDRRHKAAVRTTYTGVRNLTLATVLDFQTGTPINRAAGFDANGPIDLDGSGDTYGNGFLGNQDRFFGVPRNGERLPSAFRADLSAAYRVPTVRGGVELRADVFNVLNAVNESGFANGIGGGGSRTQVGRPGDPLVFGSVAPPRQIQLSVRYAL
jgi:hypothetical protein